MDRNQTVKEIFKSSSEFSEHDGLIVKQGSNKIFTLSRLSVQELASEILRQTLMTEKPVWSDEEMALFIGKIGVHKATLLRWAKKYGARRTPSGRWNAASVRVALKKESYKAEKLALNS